MGPPRTFTVWPPTGTLRQRVTVDTTTGCWLWQGRLTKGHPTCTWQYRQIRVRRWVWALTSGQDSKHPLNTSCDNPRCVNPKHLYEIRPPQKCGKGHPMDRDNTYRAPNGEGRDCKECVRLRQHKPSYLNRKAAYTADYQRRADVKVKRAEYHRRKRERLTTARVVERDIAYWSPSAQRWMLNEGHRWITGGEREAFDAIHRHLRPSVPRQEERSVLVGWIMTHLQQKRAA